MITDKQKKQQILRKFRRLPIEKLTELDKSISDVEQKISNQSKILSFAGSWKDINDDIFDDFTKNLINKRKNSKRSII